MPFPFFSRQRAAQASERRMQEQINPFLYSSSLPPTADPAVPLAGTEEDYYWRSLSTDLTQKDFQPATYLELHNACYEAYCVNPIAYAIIEITANFVLGKGVSLSANEPEVMAVLQRFWRDADNHMDMRVYSLCTELALYGEQFIRFYVNPIDGSVKIRQLDPACIEQIELDPQDVERVLRFRLRPSPASATAISPDSALQEGTWLEAGSEVVQFCINKVSNATRGRSDLAPLLPWLRRYKEWLLDRVRINKYKGAFLWDVELRGADRKMIERKKVEYGYPPEPGSVIFHNESERWTTVKPEIQASDAEADGRALKLMIAVGVQFPICDMSVRLLQCLPLA